MSVDANFESGNEGGEDSGPDVSQVQYQAPEVTESSGNPAWSPIFERIPTEFHNQIRPELEKWDQNFQQMQERYKPFDQFRDVPVEKLTQGNQLVDLLNSNPMGVLQRLAENLGVTIQEAAQVVQNGQQQSSPDEEYDLDDPDGYDSRLAQIQQQQEQMANAWNQWQQGVQQQQEQARYEQTVQQESAAIDSAFKEIREKHGEFDESALVQRIMFDVNSGRGMDINRAHSEMMAYEAQVRSRPTPGGRAPYVTPTSGGVPNPNTKSIEDLNKDERLEYVRQMLASQRNGE